MSMEIKEIPIPSELTDSYTFIRCNIGLYVLDQWHKGTTFQVHPKKAYMVITGTPGKKTKDYFLAVSIRHIIDRIVVPIELVKYQNDYTSGRAVDLLLGNVPGKIIFKGKQGKLIKKINEKVFWVRFNEDVGGCSLDGSYPKGSVLVLGLDQIEENVKKEIKRKQRPRYKAK